MTELSDWALVYKDEPGHFWWLSGLTRSLARERLAEVHDALYKASKNRNKWNEPVALALVALTASGEMAEYLDMRGQWEKQVQWGQRSLEAAKALGIQRHMAAVTHHLAIAHHRGGNLPQAEELYRESLVIEQQSGNQQGIAQTLHNLGVLAQNQRRYPDAEKLYKESLNIKRQLGHQQGTLAQDQGRYQAAAELYTESLKIKRQLGDQHGIATTLAQTALLLEKQDRTQEAVPLLQEALAIFQTLKSPYAAQAEAALARVREKLSGQDKDERKNRKTNSNLVIFSVQVPACFPNCYNTPSNHRSAP